MIGFKVTKGESNFTDEIVKRAIWYNNWLYGCNNQLAIEGLIYDYTEMVIGLHLLSTDENIIL